MWYSSSALRYFSPNLLNRNAFIFGPSFLNAKLSGAKTVLPTWVVVFKEDSKPVLVRPRESVLNSPGSSDNMVATGGGGMRIWSIACYETELGTELEQERAELTITPFVPK